MNGGKKKMFRFNEAMEEVRKYIEENSDKMRDMAISKIDCAIKNRAKKGAKDAMVTIKVKPYYTYGDEDEYCSEPTLDAILESYAADGYFVAKFEEDTDRSQLGKMVEVYIRWWEDICLEECDRIFPPKSETVIYRSTVSYMALDELDSIEGETFYKITELGMMDALGILSEK